MIPFPDATFDYVLCTEVLEHVENPGELIAEMRRVLRPGGLIVATVPFSARVHHAPHDFHRYTRYRLASLVACVGATVIEERGDDLATLANKLIVICMRLARPSRASRWGLALLVALAPIALLALAVAHASLAFRWGSRADPLGYGVASIKI
ncbi:MAG: methyltransferase domain-containing protein [Alphaproteobacteria bacterium]|nr:methyltransferase domain-containing protein [Alphaproteobacteria bacterium]